MADPTLDFLAGGGEMGELTRRFDWGSTPVGAPESWPQSLRVAVRIMLNTGHPMFIFWGPELIQFYNDAYRRTMGPERHPAALGQRGRECWDEIWHIIGPQITHVMTGKGATWDEDKLIPVTRNGRREDVWWTYSYGPIDAEDGGVGGVLVVCTDVTEQHQVREAAKRQRLRLEQMFEQAPGFMAMLDGPDHVFQLANAAYRKLVGGREVVGRPVREALPEVVEQGFTELLDRVRLTGLPHVGQREPVMLRVKEGEPLRQVFLDFVYQPVIADDGEVTGVFVVGHDVTDHVRAEDHLRLVNDELKHRVKNTLAMVSSIAGQTLRGTGGSSEEALHAFHQRLATFGRAHDILTTQAWASASVREVVETALHTFESEIEHFTIEGPDTTIGAKQALSLALAVHELATNAAKYGSLTAKEGQVSISWREEGSSKGPRFCFEWRESGGPPVTPPSHGGFGTRLIDRVLTADFKGDVKGDYRPDGVVFTLRAPISAMQNVLASPFAEIAEGASTQADTPAMKLSNPG